MCAMANSGKFLGRPRKKEEEKGGKESVVVSTEAAAGGYNQASIYRLAACV